MIRSLRKFSSLLTVTALLCSISLETLGQTGPGGVGTIGSLEAWLASDNGVFSDAGATAATNGSTIRQWNDRAGNGNFIQTNASERPTLVTNVINGRPVVRFDGSNDFMDRINNSGSYSTTSVFIVGQFAQASQQNGDHDFMISIGNTYFDLVTICRGRLDQPVANRYFSFTDNDFLSSSNTISNGMSVFAQRFNNSSPFHRMNINGQALTVEDNGLPVNVGRNVRLGAMWISATNAPYELNGDIAELLLYDEFIGDASTNIIENYLAAKYNLTIANDLYAFESTHGNEVAGIGRESATDLNNDAQGTGIVRINNPSSLSDGDYLLFGHDGGALTGTGSSAVAGIQNEVARSWVADLNTGNVGTVNISFNIGSVPFSLGADPAEYRLLLDDDGNFANGGTTVSSIGPSGSTTITFAGVNLYSGGPYFKLAHTGVATLCTAFFDGDWDNGIIWSCPGFPDSTNNAELDPGVTVTVTGAESVNDLTLQSNSSLVLNSGTSLIIKGDLVIENGATIVADPSSTILFRGLSGGQAVTNNTGNTIAFGNVVINDADQVDFTQSDYSISGGLSLVNGDLNVDGDLIFTSSAAAHGHLRAINGNDINAGGFTTQRFMSGRAANWNDIATLAIPTTIADLDNEIFISGVAGADGFAQNTNGGGFISLWYFDNATQQYVAVGNVTEAMPVGRGYEAWLGDNLTVWNAKAWDFNGATMNYQATNMSLTGGWNLIGNPLPGFLDFAQIAADNPQINGGEYWHYDANNGNYGTVSGAGSFVPPGQGFWLFCTSGFTLSIDPAVYLRNDLNTSNLFKLQTDQDESFKVAVKNKGEGTVFGSAIYLRKDPQAFSGIDAMDIPPLKVPDSRAVRMWMDFNGQERMVNYVNTDEEHIEVPLYIESGLPGQFEMSFSGLEYFKDYQCFNLLNEETGEQIEIYPEASYAFTINEQLDPLNMKILISKKDYADCMAPTTFSENEVRVFSNDKMIHADFYLDRTAEASISVMNSLGQVVHTERASVSYNRNSIDMSNAQAGIYFVNIQINGQSKTEKVILQ